MIFPGREVFDWVWVVRKMNGRCVLFPIIKSVSRYTPSPKNYGFDYLGLWSRRIVFCTTIRKASKFLSRFCIVPRREDHVGSICQPQCDCGWLRLSQTQFLVDRQQYKFDTHTQITQNLTKILVVDDALYGKATKILQLQGEAFSAEWHCIPL